MAKNEISDYDETNANNTDISGIAVTNATLIAQVDDIVRAQMGALKRWFKTSLFRLRDSTDQTKLLAFDLSALTTATTRTQKVPNYDGTQSLQAKGADIATASTINLDTATGEYIDLTGTITVTAITLGSGLTRRGRVVSGFSITAGAAIVVNGNATGTYPIPAGSLLFFEGYGSNLVYVWSIGQVVTTSTVGNGRWIKYPDGTQECWETVNTSALAIATAMATGGGFRSAGQVWTYPASFLAVPSVTATVTNLTAFGVVVADQTAAPAVSLTYCFVGVTSDASTPARTVAFHAKGRWY